MKQTSNLVSSLLLGLTSLDQASAVKLGYAYGTPEVDRDAEYGYPSSFRSNAEVTHEVEDYLHDRGQYGDTFQQQADKEKQIEDSLDQAYSKPSFKIPAGLLSYSYNDDKFAKRQKTLLQLDDDEDTNNRNRESQLSDNMKQAFHPFEPRRDSYVQWNIDDGVKKQANNDDILNQVSEPLKIEGEKRTAADAQFIKNMNAMETVKGELGQNEVGMANLINRQRIAIEDGNDMPMSLAEKRSQVIEMNGLNGDEQSFGGYNLVQMGSQDDNRFNGQPIGALVEHGSAALKLNVHEITGTEEQVEQEDYLMTQWDLDVHGKQNAFDNSEILTTIRDKLPESDFFQNKRENARNFGSELEDLRIEQGDKTYQEIMQRRSTEVPSYMENYDEDNFSKLNIAPISGSEESVGGLNVMVQTGSSDDDKIAFAGVKGLSNQEILYSVTNDPNVKGSKVDTAAFVGDLDALAQEIDPSMAQKGVRKVFRSLDDNLKVHDLSFEETPNKDAYVQWEMQDAMVTKTSNDEILGEVYLPQVERNELEQMPPIQLAQHEIKYIQDKQEMSQLKFGEGEYEVTMNMQPISDEEQQWNGDELSAVQLDQQWIPTTLGDDGATDFGGQFIAARAEAAEQASTLTPAQFTQDLNQLRVQTDQAAAKALQEEQDQKYLEFAQMHKFDGDLGFKIHGITGTEGQYNGDFEGYTGY